MSRESNISDNHRDSSDSLSSQNLKGDITAQESNDNNGEEFNSDDADYDESTDSSDENEYLMYYERAIQEIEKGDSYTCMICTVEMDYTCKMFACKHCYRVFDYDCISEWAEKSAGKSVDGVWKCPNCYHASKKIPIKNRPTCWCGKTITPDPNPISPNSCGQTCNAKICVHGCTQFCHLGPHPECNRMISLNCRCGKNSKEIFCHEAKQLKGSKIFQCNDECGLFLPCGIHKCKRKCHSGLCGECPNVLIPNKGCDIKIKCYCGNTSKPDINCKDVKMPILGNQSKDSDGNVWIGVFKCNDIRSVTYSCHEHSFDEACKAPPTLSGKIFCPLSPKQLKTCPCGKTHLKTFTIPRSKCTDPIPTCKSICGKTLKCGKHKCPFTCHNGPCMDPCMQIETRQCSCNQKLFNVPCTYQGNPKCNLKCESLMSCRRHRCVERCCSSRPFAERRKKQMLNSQNILDESLVEAGHICIKDCNLKLSCGLHYCNRKCHPGKCPPCLISDSNDLVCPCGETVIEAPVRCGTKLPTCLFPCIKVREGTYPCGHKPPPHACHPTSEPCPPCTVTAYKPCACGKNPSAKTVCFQTNVSCGQICGKNLLTCHHICQNLCHSEGKCQVLCKQNCGKQRENCSHKCIRKCHGFKSCPDVPCSVIMKLLCECGRRESYKPCGTTLQIPSVGNTYVLSCDDECLKFQRHQQLKEAFGIQDSTGDLTSEIEKTKSFLTNVTELEELGLPFSELVLAVYSKQNRWCDQIEEILNKLIEDPNRTSLHFKPMKAPQRNFIVGLASAYKLYAESQDPEPKRSVYVKKMIATCSPGINLQEALPLYQSYKTLEKERKSQHFESRLNTKYINYEPKEIPVTSVIKYNGFYVKKLLAGTTANDLKHVFDLHLKPSLIRKIQYLILPDNKNAIIYPEDYSSVTESVQADIETFAGHLDFIGKESMLCDGIEPYNISEFLIKSEEKKILEETPLL